MLQHSAQCRNITRCTVCCNTRPPHSASRFLEAFNVMDYSFLLGIAAAPAQSHSTPPPPLAMATAAAGSPPSWKSTDDAPFVSRRRALPPARPPARHAVSTLVPSLPPARTLASRYEYSLPSIGAGVFSLCLAPGLVAAG